MHKMIASTKIQKVSIIIHMWVEHDNPGDTDGDDSQYRRISITQLFVGDK